MAEFWENHFTTDYDKVADYLDNVLNVKGKANENYAREILELFAFGVDNRYKQSDIEQLAECFTGWGVCKVAQEQAQSFPESALLPPTDCEVKSEETVLLDLGAGWRFFKGVREPTPGSTGLGYGDGDDATVLNDMRGNYYSVYLRRRFLLDDPDGYSELGFDWIDTASMLERIDFARDLAQNRKTDYYWDAILFMDERNSRRSVVRGRHDLPPSRLDHESAREQPGRRGYVQFADGGVQRSPAGSDHRQRRDVLLLGRSRRIDQIRRPIPETSSV